MIYSLVNSIDSFANEFLTFYIPIFYTFKFLQSKNQMKIKSVLKFWCILSCYTLLSYLLKEVIDKQMFVLFSKIFPFINLFILAAINIPPYEIAQKIYDSTLGPLFNENKKTLEKIEGKLKEVFEKKTETIKNKVKDSTSERMKGLVGEALKATINPGSQKSSSSDEKHLSQSQSDEDQ